MSMIGSTAVILQQLSASIYNVLDNKMKALEVKADEDTGVFFSKLLNINSLFVVHRVGEGFAERRLIGK